MREDPRWERWELSHVTLANLHGLARAYAAGSPARAAVDAEIARREPPAPEAQDAREREVQHHVCNLLRAHGAKIYSTSSVVRARITPGIPDLIVFVPGRGLVFVEVKAPGGRATPAQVEFRELCLAAGAQHVLGGVKEVAAFLGIEAPPPGEGPGGERSPAR